MNNNIYVISNSKTYAMGGYNQYYFNLIITVCVIYNKLKTKSWILSNTPENNKSHTTKKKTILFTTIFSFRPVGKEQIKRIKTKLHCIMKTMDTKDWIQSTYST